MMKCGIENYVAQFGRAVIKLILLSTVLLGAGAVNAASITGSLGLTGAFAASGGTDLSDATMLNLMTVFSTGGDGDLAVLFGTGGTVNTSPFSIDPPGAVPNLLEMDNWKIDIGTMAVVDQTASVLTLEGSGTVSALIGTEFDPTPMTWSLSANASGSTYSMTISAIPVPAAVWLFGSGLIGLIAVARRKVD
jgi:hypothetical protein